MDREGNDLISGHWISLFGLVLLFGVLIAPHAWAYRMIPMNLEEMSVEAERVVVATCLAREEGEFPTAPGGPPVRFTQYTFQVTDNLKGNTGQTLTIRQVRLGARSAPTPGEPPLRSGRPLLPDYQPGQEVLLFLGPDSSLGLTSPVALDDAVFDVETQNGQKVLKHRSENRGLFRDMSSDQVAAVRGLSSDETALFHVKERERIPAAPFFSLVRKLSRGR